MPRQVLELFFSHASGKDRQLQQQVRHGILLKLSHCTINMQQVTKPVVLQYKAAMLSPYGLHGRCHQRICRCKGATACIPQHSHGTNKCEVHLCTNACTTFMSRLHPYVLVPLGGSLTTMADSASSDLLHLVNAHRQICNIAAATRVICGSQSVEHFQQGARWTALGLHQLRYTSATVGNAPKLPINGWASCMRNSARRIR